MSRERTNALSTYKFWNYGFPEQVKKTTFPSQLYIPYFMDWEPPMNFSVQKGEIKVLISVGTLAQLTLDLEHAVSRGCHHYLEHGYACIFWGTTHSQDISVSKMWSQPYQKMCAGITFQNQWSPHFCILWSGPVVNRFAKTLMILSVFSR